MSARPLNQTHLRRYQAHVLRTGELTPRTVRLHVAALRFFFVKTLKRRYLLDDTPSPKAPRRLPTILTSRRWRVSSRRRMACITARC